jgi:membrane protease YdiL (CAAX protease family)
MIFSFFAVKQGNLSFAVVAFAIILRDLSLVSLILFFMWRNGEPVDLIGWTWKNGWKEVGLGLGLYLPFFTLAALLERALRTMGLSSPSTPLPSFLVARGMADFFLAPFLVAIVSVSEETLFRGYLLLRLTAITSNRTSVAVILSAIVFSLGHGYEGSAGVVTVGVMGFVFALIYIWRQSLVAPVVMHFLQDFIGIVLLPLLGKR